MRHLVVGAVATFVVDQASKAFVRSAFPLGQGVRLPAGFAIVHVANPGITLGFGSGYPHVWVAVGVLAVATILFAHHHLDLGVRADWLWGLLLGGAVGNLLGRSVYGVVTDFLQVPVWPGVMNVADIAVRFAVLALVVVAVRRHVQAGRAASQPVAS